MIQVIDGVIKQYRLPKVGSLSDGTTVSGYDKLSETTLKNEGWLPLEDVKPKYDVENEYLIPRYVIYSNKVVKEYVIKPILKSEYEIVREEIQKIVLERDLSGEEMLDKINIYPDWEDVEVGESIKENTYLKYQDNLYQVITGKTHNKQLDWTPLVASLFNKVLPKGVIPEWVQPTGGHDAYAFGDKVTYKGKVWESLWKGNPITAKVNTTVPDGDVPHNRYWKPVV